MPNLETIRESLRTQGAQVRDLSAQLAQACMNEQSTSQEIESLQQRVNRARIAYDALRGEAEQMEREQRTQAQGAQPRSAQAPSRTLRDILKSNEYARAFAFAIRNGITPRQFGGEETKILFDALTIGGGDPVGTDGGFLVPDDVDHMIREQRRALNPLADLFTEEPVTANSGWRVGDNAPTTGFSAVNEMATVPSNSQPSFRKITYTLTKYGMILPVSNELSADEVAGLLAYIARWGAKKSVITENTLLLAKLNAVSGDAIAAEKELAGIKKLLNVVLDPAIALSAALITNQDGFNALDSLEDNTGRPLLQPDPKDGTPRLFGSKPVYVFSNAQVPSASVQAPTASNAAPIWVGDGKQFATLFSRNPMEVLSTNIGGNAFSTDSTEIRFIKRMDAEVFDEDAMAKGTLTV